MIAVFTLSFVIWVAAFFYLVYLLLPLSKFRTIDPAARKRRMKLSAALAGGFFILYVATAPPEKNVAAPTPEKKIDTKAAPRVEVKGNAAPTAAATVAQAPFPSAPWSSPEEIKAIQIMCETVAAEDEDNNGIRADGTPWKLDDLIIDASIRYSIEQWQQPDLKRGRVDLRGALLNQKKDDSIAILCSKFSRPVRSDNASINEPVATAIAVAQGEATENKPSKEPQATAAEKSVAKQALCDIVAGQIKNGVLEDKSMQAMVLMSGASKLVEQRWGVDQWRAAEIVMAEVADLNREDPNGNFVTLCFGAPQAYR